MFHERLRKAVTALHARANVPEDIPHHLVRRLLRQCLQGLNHGQPGIDHRRQLPGENDQVRQPDFAAAGSSLLADFFLDGNDQEVAI